jgi:hypothetical protein
VGERDVLGLRSSGSTADRALSAVVQRRAEDFRPVLGPPAPTIFIPIHEWDLGVRRVFTWPGRERAVMGRVRRVRCKEAWRGRVGRWAADRLGR